MIKIFLSKREMLKKLLENTINETGNRQQLPLITYFKVSINFLFESNTDFTVMKINNTEHENLRKINVEKKIV